MNVIIVSYDLCGINKDYDGLIERIKQYPRKAKLNESCWIIATKYDSASVRDQLMPFIDNDDLLFVAKLTGEAAWHKALSTNEEIKYVFKQ